LSLPRGTLTFLFTDIEGSTQLMQQVGERYVAAQSAHHSILRAAFDGNSGHELRTEGDSFFCVFASAVDACLAAADAQRSLDAYPWPDGASLKVRIGLHTGEAPLVGNEYIGLDVHHAARIAAAAHGGQVLVSEATHGVVDTKLPTGLRLRDLGEHRLKDLARPELLYQLVIDGVPDTFPALRTLDAIQNNLPTQLTSFIGRGTELAEASGLLQKTRLLTLTGPGGIGKTRLCLQVAAESSRDFPSGAYFIPLSAVRDPELIGSAVAQVLGIPVTGNRLPIDGVVDHLRDKNILLVLDNFEQLLPAGAPLASQLLHAGPGVKLLVSSRAVLHVYGEQEFAVEPLRLPDHKARPGLEQLSQYEAVKLFIERAIAAKPDFQATNENAPSIAGICERVDGLPLAIELAAARVKLFSPQALLARLETSLSVLGSGARDLPSRQQTLRGAIDWSYDLLDDAQKRLLARFSVFARGANLEQAEAVCGPPDEVGGDVLSVLDELADHSLLRRQPDFEEPRLIMLQTIREFALERLDSTDEAGKIRERHFDAYCRLAEVASPNLFGDQQRTWLDRLERDHDNFRAAFDWCAAAGDVERAMNLAANFWRFWQMRGHLHEGRARLGTILEMKRGRNYREARIRALEAAGGIAYWQGDMTAARAFYDECLELARAGVEKSAIANALYNAAFPTFIQRSDIPRSLELFGEALPIYRELGDDPGIRRCLWGIANCLYYQERYDESVVPLDEAIGMFRKTDDRFGLGWALHTRALLAIRAADFGRARPLVREALQIFAAAGDVSGIVLVLDDAGDIERLAGDRALGLRLAAAAATHQTASGAELGRILNVTEQRSRVEDLTDEEDQRAWAEGRAMTIDQAVAVSLGTASTTSVIKS
jgi:predicted ATPase/class 3 adenylate cyclase